MVSEDPHSHHRSVGLAMIGFSAVGITLGIVMTALGIVGEGFLDGPSAFVIGVATLLVGLGLRFSGRADRG
jgi:hypothetical protein